MTAAGFLVMLIATVVAFIAGCAYTERHPTEPIDPDEANLCDAAVTYIGGWLPRPRSADARLQSVCRAPAVVALPRRTPRRTR